MTVPHQVSISSIDLPLSSHENWLPFGYVANAHGIRGELLFVPYDGGEVHLEPGSKIKIAQNGQPGKIQTINKIRMVPKGILVSLAGCHDRNVAQSFKGGEILLPAQAFPALQEGEFYLHELVGATALTEEGDRLGIIQRFIARKGQDLISIESDRGELLYPLVEGAVLAFRREEGEAELRTIEGLWE